MNNSMTDISRDPQTLEREIGQTRAEINETLDILERKLTAGQLLDQCLKFFGKTGTEIGSSLGKSIQENPISAVLTATGIAWMIFSPGRSSSSRLYDDFAANTGAMADAYNATTEGFSKVGDKIKSGAAGVQSQLASSKGAVKDSVDKTTSAVKETFNKTGNLAQAQARRARDGFNSLLEEQPLILGALGLALGAAIGAALPSTEQEDRLMGEARDKTLAKGKELGAKAYEKAHETVKQATEDIVQSVPDKSGDSRSCS